MTEPPPPPPPPEYGQGGQPYGQPYGQQPYGQAPGQYDQPWGQPQQSSSKAVVALVLGIVGLFFCQLLVGIAALVVGRNAVREIDASGGRLGGRGMATAGWILGLVDLVLGVLAVIFVIVVLGTGNSSSM